MARDYRPTFGFREGEGPWFGATEDVATGLKSAVYIIYCRVDGRFYVGSTVDVRKRWQRHIWALRNNKTKFAAPLLLEAWKATEPTDWEFYIIEWCPPIRARLNEREQFYIDEYHTAIDGLNRHPKAESARGVIHSEETKRKHQGHRGHSGFKGRSQSDATKAKCRDVNLNKPKSEMHKRHLKDAWARRKEMGIPHPTQHTPEVIQKIKDIKARNRAAGIPSKISDPEVIQKIKNTKAIKKANTFLELKPCTCWRDGLTLEQYRKRA